ncbi:TraB/GumN family protein [Massilia sp. H-1]|nr:TraB/GumN family protein [Massilia sp. H-1]
MFCLALPSAWGADRGALFKVTGDGHSMYLFGTIHVGQPEFYPLEPRIVAAMNGASKLALEVDPDTDPGAVEAARRKYGLYPDGASGDEMTPVLRERTRQALAKAGIDADAMSHVRPWLVATVLAIAEYSAQGYRTDLSVESHLVGLAKAKKVPVISLETVTAQLSLFDRLSEAEQLRFLEESVTLIESGRQRAEVRQIVEAWRTADRRTFDEIAARAAADTTLSGRFVKKVLLDERNIGLADKLAYLLEAGKQRCRRHRGVAFGRKQ